MFKPFAPHMVDGYKLSHADMYAEGTDFLYSNLTPRSNKHFKGSSLYDGKMVVFGSLGAIQEIVELWDETFFKVSKKKAMARFKRRVSGYVGADAVDFNRMGQLHDIGYLPLHIKTLDEGLRINMKVPILTIRNTLPEFFWLVNFLETMLSAMIWKGCTNATIAYEYKRLATDWAIRTGTPIETVQYQIHDFSMRGMPGLESACRSSASQLSCGVGTDTVGAIDYIEDYYGSGLDLDNYLIGCSIPATEHAVSSSNILKRAAIIKERFDGLSEEEARFRGEVGFLLDYITKTVPTGLCAYVADTYDYWAVLTDILTIEGVKERIMARDGKLVIRPDSGDPVDVICGSAIYIDVPDDQCDMESAVGQYFRENHKSFPADGGYELTFVNNEGTYMTFQVSSYEDSSEDIGVYYEVHCAWYEDETPELKGSIQLLWENFGGTVNEKGFKELDSHIGLIYGDSITIQRAEEIFKRLAAKGFASGNVVFGVGSYTYQMNTRDTFGTAMKATATGFEDTLGVFEIYKDPATGDKLKKSAKGLLRVDRDENGELVLKDQVSVREELGGELKTRFLNGKLFNLDNIETIRKRLA